MFRNLVSLPGLVVSGALVLSGCGPAKGTLSGSVTMDGQPLDKGVISFSAAAAGDGSPPVTVDIVNGKYFADMTVGEKAVQISSQVVVGQRKQYNAPDAPLDDIWEERLPARYNSESTLTATVKSGSNLKDWQVESIRGKK